MPQNDIQRCVYVRKSTHFSPHIWIISPLVFHYVLWFSVISCHQNVSIAEKPEIFSPIPPSLSEPANHFPIRMRQRDQVHLDRADFFSVLTSFQIQHMLEEGLPLAGWRRQSRCELQMVVAKRARAFWLVRGGNETSETVSFSECS